MSTPEAVSVGAEPPANWVPVGHVRVNAPPFVIRRYTTSPNPDAGGLVNASVVAALTVKDHSLAIAQFSVCVPLTLPKAVEVNKDAGMVGRPVNTGDASNAPPTPVTSAAVNVTAPLRVLNVVTPEELAITTPVVLLLDTAIVALVVDCGITSVALLATALVTVTVNAPVVRFRNVHSPVVGTVTVTLAVNVPVNTITGTLY